MPYDLPVLTQSRRRLKRLASEFIERLPPPPEPPPPEPPPGPRQFTPEEVEQIRQFHADRLAGRLPQQRRRPTILPSPVDVSEEEMAFGPKPPTRGRFAMAAPPAQGPPEEAGRQRLEELRRGDPFRRRRGVPIQAEGALTALDLLQRGTEIGTAFLSQPLTGPSRPFAETLGRHLQRPGLERFVTEGIVGSFMPPFGLGAGKVAAKAGAAAREAVPLARREGVALASMGEEAPKRFTVFQEDGLWFVRDSEVGVTFGGYRSRDTADRIIAKAEQAEINNAVLVRRNLELEEGTRQAKLGARKRARAASEVRHVTEVTSEQPGAIQAGMGIGEVPAQGELGIGGRIAAQEPLPLIDEAQVAAEAAKEPWQMTRTEFAAGKSLMERRADSLKPIRDPTSHYAQIAKAINEGKPVPPEVRAEWLDLPGGPQSPVGTILARMGIEVGDFIGSATPALQGPRGVRGIVEGEGILGTDIPAWRIRGPNGEITAIAKDDAQIISKGERASGQRPMALIEAENLRLAEQRAAIAVRKLVEANLPAVPEGYVRLYRGEPANALRPRIPPAGAPMSFSQVPGRWFTTDVGYTSFYGPNIAYVDVPKVIADEALVGRAATGGDIPIEWAAKAQPLTSTAEWAAGQQVLRDTAEIELGIPRGRAAGQAVLPEAGPQAGLGAGTPTGAAQAPAPAARPATVPPPVIPPPRPPAPPGSNLDKFDNMWSEGGKKPPLDIPAFYRTIQEYANDNYWGLRHLQKEVSSRITITPGGEKDLITLLTRGPGAVNAGATRAALVAEEIKQAARGVPVDDINTIIFAKHGKEVMEAKGPQRVIAGGFRTQAELDDALKALELRMGQPAFRRATAAAEVVKRAYQEELGRLVAEGLISPEDAAIFAQKYPWYNPIRYVEYAAEQAAQGRNVKPFSVTRSGVQRLSDVGSLEAARSPLEVLGEQLIRNEVRIQKNQTARAIIALALEPPKLGVTKISGVRPVAKVEGKDVFRPTTQDIPGTLSFFEKGKKQTYKVPDWIYQEAEVLNQTLSHPVSSFIGALNGVSRSAFTTFSIPFVAANMANDALMAGLTRGILPHQTGATLIRSLRGLENDRTMQAFRLSGGFQQRFFGRSPKDFAHDVGLSGGTLVGDNFSFRRVLLDAIPRAGEAGEQAPRMALFRRQLDNTLPGWRGMTPEAVAATPQARKAAAEAVELTINFARGGYLVKSANPFVIFLNASMEGTKLPFRALLTNPAGKRAVGLRLAGVGAGMMGLAAYNLSYPEYFDVPDSIRWGSVVVMLPSKEKDINGNLKPNYVTIIPRTREWGAFLGPTVYTMEKMFTDSPTEFGTFTKTVVPQLSPMNQIPSPEIIMELGQQMANYDFFWNQPIVPQEVENLPRTEQVTPWVSRTIQKVAETIGASPVRVQHAVHGIFGGAGRTVTSVSDYILDLVAPRQDSLHVRTLVAQYEALDTPTKQRMMLTGLDKIDREMVLAAGRQPEKEIPIVGPVVRRFVPGRGGQLYRTGEAVAKAATGISPKATRVAAENLRSLSDVFLDEQKASDARLSNRTISGQAWRKGRGDQSKMYQGALELLKIQIPTAAQVQQDETVSTRYYNAVSTLAGSASDRRDRAQILAAGWYAIPLDQAVPEHPDFNTFFTMRDEYKARLSPADHAILNEYLVARQTLTEKRFEAAKDILRPYWELNKEVFTLDLPDKMKDTWREYIGTASPNEKTVLQLTNPWLNRLDALVGLRKEYYRKAHPNVDAALTYWEYSTKPRTIEGVKSFMESVGVR